MNKTSRYHHYLPKSYLYGFTNDNGMIWVCNKSTGVIKELSPKVFGGENHFYSIKMEDGRVDVSVENELIEVDGRFMDMLRKLQEYKQLTVEDRADLSLILALFMTRVPHFKKFVEEGLNILMKKVMETSANHKESFYAKLNTLGVTEDQFEKTRQFALNEEYDIKPSNNYFLGYMIKLALDIAPLFNMFEWTIGIVPNNTTFMTLDNPIALIPSLDMKSQYRKGIGLLTPGLTIHFPLNKSLMLGMKFTEIPTKEINYGRIPNRKYVRYINHDLFLSAEKYVVSSDKKWLEKIQEIIRNEK